MWKLQAKCQVSTIKCIEHKVAHMLKKKFLYGFKPYTCGNYMLNIKFLQSNVLNIKLPMSLKKSTTKSICHYSITTYMTPGLCCSKAATLPYNTKGWG